MTKSNFVIIQPVLSEKSTAMSSDLRKYVFKIQKTANKLEVKKAIENRFNVRVNKVATMNVRGKVKNQTIRSNDRVIRTSGKTSSWKKAIVTLSEGYTIDIVGGEG